MHDLAQRGVGAFTVAPPFFRLLWALGVELPPPLFLGFITLTVVMGGFFAASWGVLMWLAWQLSAPAVAAAAGGAGLLFGLSMAVYYRVKAAELGLPSWSDYPPY
jgi:hypothetical protein